MELYNDLTYQNRLHLRIYSELLTILASIWQLPSLDPTRALNYITSRREMISERREGERVLLSFVS